MHVMQKLRKNSAKITQKLRKNYAYVCKLHNLHYYAAPTLLMDSESGAPPGNWLRQIGNSDRHCHRWLEFNLEMKASELGTATDGVEGLCLGVY